MHTHCVYSIWRMHDAYGAKFVILPHIILHIAYLIITKKAIKYTRFFVFFFFYEIISLFDIFNANEEKQSDDDTDD